MIQFCFAFRYYMFLCIIWSSLVKFLPPCQFGPVSCSWVLVWLSTCWWFCDFLSLLFCCLLTLLWFLILPLHHLKYLNSWVFSKISHRFWRYLSTSFTCSDKTSFITSVLKICKHFLLFCSLPEVFSKSPKLLISCYWIANYFWACTFNKVNS